MTLFSQKNTAQSKSANGFANSLALKSEQHNVADLTKNTKSHLQKLKDARDSNLNNNNKSSIAYTKSDTEPKTNGSNAIMEAVKKRLEQDKINAANKRIQDEIDLVISSAINGGANACVSILNLLKDKGEELIAQSLSAKIIKDYHGTGACGLIVKLDNICFGKKDIQNDLKIIASAADIAVSGFILKALSITIKDIEFLNITNTLGIELFYKHIKHFMLRGFKTRTKPFDNSRSYLDEQSPQLAFVVLDYLIRNCKTDSNIVNHDLISPIEYIVLKCRYAGLGIVFASKSQEKAMVKPQNQAMQSSQSSSLSSEQQKILFDFKMGYEAGQRDQMLAALNQAMQSTNPQDLIEAIASLDVDMLIDLLNDESISAEAVASLFAILPQDVIANIVNSVANEKAKLAALFKLFNKIYKGDKSSNKDIFKKCLKSLDYDKLEAYFATMQKKAQLKGRVPVVLKIISEERAAAMALSLKPSDLLLIMERGGQVAAAIARNLPQKYKEIFKGLPAFEKIIASDPFLKNTKDRGFHDQYSSSQLSLKNKNEFGFKTPSLSKEHLDRVIIKKKSLNEPSKEPSIADDIIKQNDKLIDTVSKESGVKRAKTAEILAKKANEEGQQIKDIKKAELDAILKKAQQEELAKENALALQKETESKQAAKKAIEAIQKAISSDETEEDSKKSLGIGDVAAFFKDINKNQERGV